jgi:hypothetical protein
MRTGWRGKYFGPKREEVAGDWKNNRLTRMRWVGHAAHMEETRDVYKILVGKLEETWKT